MRSRITRALCALCALCVIAAMGSPAQACTSFRMQNAEGKVFYARTMEYAYPTESSISVIPAGTVLQGTLPDATMGGLKWTAKYGFGGMNSHGLPSIVDGVNEKGLIVGELVFVGYAGYQSYDPAKASQTIAQYDLPNWLLANFATVAEVRAHIGDVRVCQGPEAAQGVEIGPLPLHFTVHDATGASLVIEYVDGVVNVHDNPLGVLTNAPPLPWMLTYLSNYVNLTAVNVPMRKLGGFTVHQFGQGSGMLGLPGDFTPPNRFLRMVALTQSAIPAKGLDAALNLAMTIIDNVDIPLGSVRQEDENGEILELTQWAVAVDPTRQRYYFRTYDNKNWHYVDIGKALAGAKTILTFPTAIPADYPEVKAAAK